jgi:hypothetical protein
LNFDFLADEDFGLAKSFSRAPVCALAPSTNFAKRQEVDVEREYTDMYQSEIVSEGFCFKLSPDGDVRLNQILLTLNYSKLLSKGNSKRWPLR